MALATITDSSLAGVSIITNDSYGSYWIDDQGEYILTDGDENILLSIEETVTDSGSISISLITDL